jgi:hypothetical protein
MINKIVRIIHLSWKSYFLVAFFIVDLSDGLTDSHVAVKIVAADRALYIV